MNRKSSMNTSEKFSDELKVRRCAKYPGSVLRTVYYRSIRMIEQGGSSWKVFRKFYLSKVLANFLFFFCFRKLQQTVPVDEFLYDSNVSRKEKNKIDSLFLNHVVLFIGLVGG
jgi:hypothetical protein